MRTRGFRARPKAIALDPSLAEAHAALGLLKSLGWDYQAASSEYQRAIALNPSYERAGTLRFVLGDFSGAEKLIRESETLNPYSMALPMIRAELYYYARRYQDAINLSHEVLRMDPQNPVAPRIVARALFMMGKPQEALQNVLQVIHPASGLPVDRAEAAAYLFAARRQEGLDVLDQVARGRDRDFVDAYALAIDFARLHDRQNKCPISVRRAGIRSSILCAAFRMS